MSRANWNLREFVAAAGAAAVAVTPYWFTSRSRAAEAANDKPIFGAIGLGGQGTHDANRARGNGGQCVAVCDVQRQHAERFKEQSGGKADIYDDFRKLLERKDVEFVTIGTPDHWHTPIAIAALEAGKHVYCEKPLTLTVDEGKQLVAAVKKSGKTFQVGTQQRGDQYNLFGRAAATIRMGQLGKLQRVQVQLPLSTAEGGPFPTKPVPDGLDWDRWLGQAPMAEYCPERCHFNFRWWYEYSGGIMTDWGAHHMDVAHWALDMERSGPLKVDGTETKLPTAAGGFNTPKHPIVHYLYPNDIKLDVVAGDEGVLFEGEKGRMFVNRGRLTGKPIEEQDADPKLKESVMAEVTKLFKGNTAKMGDHMGNFFEAFKHSLPTISDVEGQHRTSTACHVGNISIRLQRALQWDAVKEEFVGDAEANSMLKREQRSPYQFQAKV